MTQKADIKFHSLLFVYLYCISQNTNLDRKGTSNYNLSNTGQNLNQETKMELFLIKDFGHLQIYSYSSYIFKQTLRLPVSRDTGGYIYIYNLYIFI